MKILITGVTGFVDRHVLRALASDQSNELYGTTLSKHENDQFEGLLLKNLLEVDLTQKESVAELIRSVQPDQIYHLASIAFGGNSFDDPQSIMHNNVQLQVNMLDAVRHHAPNAKILVVSSADVYGRIEPVDLPINESQPRRPTNPYGVSKATQEMLAFAYHHTHNLQIIVARPFNHIGKGQHPLFVVPNFLDQLHKLKLGEIQELRVGNLSSARDYSDVRDVVQAYQLLMSKGKVGEVYNIASGTAVKTEELLQVLAKAVGVSPKYSQDPTRVRPNEIAEVRGDASKIKSLGWAPRFSLQETIAELVSE